MATRVKSKGKLKSAGARDGVKPAPKPVQIDFPKTYGYIDISSIVPIQQQVASLQPQYYIQQPQPQVVMGYPTTPPAIVRKSLQKLDFRYPMFGYYARGQSSPDTSPPQYTTSWRQAINDIQRNVIQRNGIRSVAPRCEGSDCADTNAQSQVPRTRPADVDYSPLSQAPIKMTVTDETVLKANMQSVFANFKSTSDVSRERRVRMFLDMLAEFVLYMEKKHHKWNEDIDRTSQELKSKIDTLSTQLASFPDRSPGREKVEEQLIYYVKRLTRVYGSKSSLNFSAMKKFFVKNGRQGMRYVLRYLHDKAHVVLEDDYVTRHKEASPERANAEQQVEIYTEIENIFNSHIKRLKASNDKFCGRLGTIFEKTSGKYGTIPEDKKADLDIMIEQTYEKIRNHTNKINLFYELKYSLLEMIMDSQFFVVYLLKALRILFAYVALFLATRMFVPVYEDTVYDEKKDPPPLWKYMLIFLGFDISLNVFLLVLLYLIKYLFKNEDNSFIIDTYMIRNHVYDYALCTGSTLLMGVLIGNVIIKKKYFKYKYEGMRAIRAFEKIVFYVSCVNIALPFFLMF